MLPIRRNHPAKNDMLKIFEQRGFTLVELLAVMAIMAILAGVVSGAVVGLGSTGQNTRLAGDRNTIAKSADRFFTDAFPQTYPVVELDTNGDGDVDDDDEFDLPGGDLGVRVIDFDAILSHDATRSFVPDFLKEVPDSGALVTWRVDTSTGNVFFAEDGSALVRPSLARLDVSADNAQASTAESSFQSDHEFAITMRKGEAPINTIEMTIPAGYVIGSQAIVRRQSCRLSDHPVRCRQRVGHRQPTRRYRCSGGGGFGQPVEGGR